MSIFSTLISAQELFRYHAHPDWVVVDSRCVLTEPQAGRRKYLEGHIPGAVFADLNLDLAAPHIPGKTGRHPLPSVDQVARVFSRLGIGPDKQVVAYDDLGGALAAVRVWWMLRWLGHEQVAVLDGGWQAWREAGFAIRAGEETRPEGTFIPHPNPDLVVTTAQVDMLKSDPAYRIMDARTHERYLGLNETIDPKAGHIPGAKSAPYLENLTPQGFFRSKESLASHYQGLLDGVPAANSITYCGSGVTSIHNILAMLHAGLGEGKLYVGSWSEWIVDPSHPIATEPE